MVGEIFKGSDMVQSMAPAISIEMHTAQSLADMVNESNVA
jgi:hypothetical protein